MSKVAVGDTGVLEICKISANEKTTLLEKFKVH